MKDLKRYRKIMDDAGTCPELQELTGRPGVSTTKDGEVHNDQA